MLKKATTLLIIFTLSVSSFAQQNDKRIERAKGKYENKEYIEAIKLFGKLYSEKEPSEAYIPVKYIANSYRKIGNYEQAEGFYTLVVNSANVTSEDHLNFGQTLRANGKLAAAKEQFEKFAEKSQNRVLANLLLQSMDEVKVWENSPKNFIVELGEGLNTEDSEYGLVSFQGKYFITSNRTKDFNSPESFSWDGTSFMSIYETDTAGIKGASGKLVMLRGKINTDYHDGPLTINQEQNKCIIMRINNEMRGKSFINRMKLFEGEFDGSKWKNFKELPFNSDEYNTGHPAYGKDENELFFISDRAGGQGGMDIYRVEREGKVWGEVQNLGPTINTSKNELFPYYRDDKLYYSSNGLLGYGGYDIFVAEEKGVWQAPKNLKSPINSTRDDFGIFFITDSTGYYSSNREGGIGKDDIYKFNYAEKTLTIGLSGILEYNALPTVATKVQILNENDSIIASEYTNEEGRFKFSNLPYNEDVFLTIESEDLDLIEDGRLYLTDEKGDKIKLLTRLKDGSFAFKVLKPDEIKSLALEEIDDFELVNPSSFDGVIYKKLPGDFSEPKLIYLVNEGGAIIDSMYTDAEGGFKFEKLGLDDESNYFIQIAEEDPELEMVLLNELDRYYQIENLNDGKFNISNDQLININTGITGIIARVETFGKPKSAAKIKIYNKKDSLIATVFSNKFGEFQYNRLRIDERYCFRVDELSEEESLNTKMYVADNQAGVLFLIKRVIDNRYAFNALPYDEYYKLKSLQASRVPNSIELKGQVFKKLQGDFDENMKVYLLDEAGNVVDSMYTDEEGNFTFEKLNADQNYSFKLDDSEGVNLVLLDADDLVIEEAIINEKGNFSYKRLTYQVANFEPLELIDSEIIDYEGGKKYFGQVYKKLPGEFKSGMEIFILNSEGEIVDSVFTDAEGRFDFLKLDSDENYYFKLKDNKDDFYLVTLDEDKNIIAKLIRNSNGEFKYRKLRLDENIVLLEEDFDLYKLILFEQEEIDLDKFTVYYRFDAVELDTVSKLKLKSFVKLGNSQGFNVEIHSYTDKRGPQTYNLKLSKQRANSVKEYLVKLGLNSKNIMLNYYGELHPVVDCEKKACNNSDHALNRRTVLKLVKIE
ncbi:OmpA family protein [Vicingaceae bacterium]|nr:OmpA family protein [bacterium]MDC1451479.1 OmpA family protein [Vicingaceae bacterium]